MNFQSEARCFNRQALQVSSGGFYVFLRSTGLCDGDPLWFRVLLDSLEFIQSEDMFTLPGRSDTHPIFCLKMTRI